MKKRIISFLLALVMLVGMFPVQAFAAEKSYVYVSFEVCDADGSGRTLIKPERNERVQYTNDYALAAMRQAIGSNSDVKYDTVPIAEILSSTASAAALSAAFFSSST